jgi:chitodextrinase
VTRTLLVTQTGLTIADATAFSDTGVQANKTYWYRVAAQDTAGRTSPYSNVARVRTPRR